MKANLKILSLSAFFFIGQIASIEVAQARKPHYKTLKDLTNSVETQMREKDGINLSRPELIQELPQLNNPELIKEGLQEFVSSRGESKNMEDHYRSNSRTNKIRGGLSISLNLIPLNMMIIETVNLTVAMFSRSKQQKKTAKIFEASQILTENHKKSDSLKEKEKATKRINKLIEKYIAGLNPQGNENQVFYKTVDLLTRFSFLYPLLREEKILPEFITIEPSSSEFTSIENSKKNIAEFFFQSEDPELTMQKLEKLIYLKYIALYEQKPTRAYEESEESCLNPH